MLGILKKIEYALRKDSLTDHERVADARSLVCAEISRVERQPNRMGGEVLTKALNAFSDFINEPTQYEDKRMVRDYRHELARKWIPVFEAIQAALVAPPTPNRTGTTPSVGGEDIAIILKFVKENVGGQPALDALDRLASGDAVAWRYQRKEGWGEIWRCSTIPVSFETPADWTVQPLYAALAAAPSRSLAGTTPEMQKMYDEFDGLGWREYMRGIENGNIDPTGERLRAVCKLAREALAATPAVGGDLTTILQYVKNARGAIESGQVTDKDVHGTLTKVIAMLDAIAAQPASPLRGREALADLVDAVECELDVEYRSFAFRKRFSAAKAALASPPEQPAADPEETK